MPRNVQIAAIAAACLAFLVAACGQDPGERAGERADTAYENATYGHADLSDGPMENAGERVDNAADDAAAEADRAANRVEDAKADTPAP